MGVVPIVVYIDHNPLTFLRSMMCANLRIMRWCLFLQAFHLDVRHMSLLTHSLVRPVPIDRWTSVLIRVVPVCMRVVHVTGHCLFCVGLLCLSSVPCCLHFFISFVKVASCAQRLLRAGEAAVGWGSGAAFTWARVCPGDKYTYPLIH